MDTPTAMWNRVADDLSDRHHAPLVAHARVLGLMDVALADATIAIWNAKNTFDTWRPITAITRAVDDRNPATSPDPHWTPLLPTPQFQEYPAGHPGVSNAAASVLARFYGDATRFTVTSAPLPGVERRFARFSAAIAQVEDARVLAGFQFRFSCVTPARMCAAVARYVTRTTMVPMRRPAGGGRD
jgi:hypothetical protein